jgi:hypothetical protein
MPDKIPDKMPDKMSDIGSVYFYNMTNQTLTLELNEDTENQLQINAIGPKPDFPISCKSVPRDSNPNPFQEAVFGLNNKITFWLANDVGHARSLEIKIDIDKLGYHLDKDFQAYVFYKKVILRVDADAEIYEGQIQKTE